MDISNQSKNSSIVVSIEQESQKAKSSSNSASAEK
jgi:hypothetical protein